MKATKTKRGGLLCLQSTSVFQSYGGIEYYLDDLLTSAAEIFGHGRVHTIVPETSEEFALEPRPYHVHPIRVRSQGLLRKLENRVSPWTFRKAVEIIRREKIDLILSGHINLGPLAYAISRWTGVPYVSAAYGIECWGGAQPQDEWAFFQSRQIFSISHWTKKILVSRGMSPGHVSIVAPCLSSAFENVTPRKITSEGPLRLLTISRLSHAEQYKGHDHVIQALARIKREGQAPVPHYTIQGDGDDRSRLESLAVTLGVGSHVTFRSRLKSREELGDLYAKTDVFIMPSRYGCWDGRWRGEGFGIVYVEAGAFGVPSIAYDCGGATDIIISGETGLLVTPDDIGGLADAILKMQADRELVAKMGDQARARALSQFTIGNLRRQLAEAITDGSLNDSPLPPDRARGKGRRRPSANP